ncbi:MAG: FAD-binding protein, partial [Balneolaceae bacterium]
MKPDIAVSSLEEKLNGEIILPDDDNYDEARAVYNGMIDKHPALIVKCKDADDVKAAVQFAQKEGMEVSIRGGGHSGPGLALVDDGMVIDLS